MNVAIARQFVILGGDIFCVLKNERRSCEQSAAGDSVRGTLACIQVHISVSERKCAYR